MADHRRGGGMEREVFDGSRIGAPPDVDLSVIIPAVDEESTIGRLLDDLGALAVPHEVIVVDGGSGDGTRDVARSMGAQVVEAPRGRGVQLAAGVRRSRAPLLCFLHADVRLGPRAVVMLERLVRARPRGAYAFRLHIDDRGPAYRLVEWEANAQARWAGLPRGDHGLIVWRSDYERAGGYPELPVLEDIAMARALARVTRIRTLPAALRVSPRRLGRDGVLRGAMRRWMMLGAFLAGASPARLAERWPQTE